MLIEAENISKVYADNGVEATALDSASLAIAEGEFVAIMGPSGSGKSTLLQILGCLDRPTGGSYRFEGKNVAQRPDEDLARIRNEKIGFVFQAFNLLPRYTVLENVKLPLVYAAGVAAHERDDRAREVIAAVGLADREQFLASKLSGGQKQRVAIARALVNRPKIIFADEPTGNLDSKSGEAIVRFLEDLNRAGNTVVIVTHEARIAERTRRLIRLQDGQIISDTQTQ